MKGNISLKEFIKEVKEDLQSAINKEDPFFYMGEVELEISFALNAEASAGAKFVVIDVGGKTKATQSHKVKIKLIPCTMGESVKENGFVTLPRGAMPMADGTIKTGGVGAKVIKKNRHLGKILMEDRNEK